MDTPTAAGGKTAPYLNYPLVAIGFALLWFFDCHLAPVVAAPPPAAVIQPADGATTTPIRHVIVVIGENRSFDHVFGVYQPPPGQTVLNLLSEGIVTVAGVPGPGFAKAAQYEAHVTSHYDPAPADKKPYITLPPLLTDGAAQRASDASGPPFRSPGVAGARDQGLLSADLPLLLTGATGLPRRSIDKRLPNVNRLPNGPYQLTPGIPYDAYAASPVHRFFQMWQQIDCSVRHANADNPSGCLSDLFPWVEVSVGAGSDGKPQSPSFNDLSTGEGSTSMGFYKRYTRPLDCRLALRNRWPRRSQLYRPCVDSQIHRTELEALAAHTAQPRQSAQPGGTRG
jgi:phospholipase C